MRYTIEIPADDYEHHESHTHIATTKRTVILDRLDHRERHWWIQLLRLIRESAQT
jgi:hypothetical protein